MSRICVYSGRVFVFTPVFVCARNAHVGACCSLLRVRCVLYQREPQEPPLSTVPAEKGPPNIANIPMTENSYLQKCFLSNTAWSTGSFFSHPQRFWSSWTDVSNFNDKNDFSSICNLWRRSVPDLPTSLLLRKATPSLHRTLLHDITQVSPTLTYMGNLTFKNCSPVQRLI